MGTSASCSRSSATRLTRRNRRVRPLDDNDDEIVLSTAVAGSKRSLANFSTPRLSFARIATMVPTGIDERWQFVEMTCNREKKYTIDHTRDWKTVRLFVSSTFSDFQSVSIFPPHRLFLNVEFASRRNAKCWPTRWVKRTHANTHTHRYIDEHYGASITASICARRCRSRLFV